MASVDGSKSISDASDGTLRFTKSQKLLMNMKVTSNKLANVVDDDRESPYITGCTFMPNDYLVLCDYWNHKIKVLNSEYKLVDKLQLKSGPWSLSAVSSERVIITLPNIKQLQYVQVFPQMKCGTTIQLEKRCFGIAVNDNEIFVSCEGSEKEGSNVQILDLDGNQKQKFDLEQAGSLKCPYPNYLTVDSKKKMIFVSNRRSYGVDPRKPPPSVTCLTFDGNVVYQFTSPKLESAKGIYVDAEGNAYVCDEANNSVHIIAKNGSHCGTLIGRADRLDDPVSIAVREKDGTVVTGSDFGYIQIFQLS